MGDSESLDKLREITPQLPPLGVTFSGGGMMEYASDEDDGAVGFSLYKSPRVAVQRTYFPAGTTFPIHCHDEKEWLIIFCGEAEVRWSDGGEWHTKTLAAGDSAYFPWRQPHSVTAIKKTWVLGVTVPASSVYPDAH